MRALLVGYARRSTDQQDLTAQRDTLLDLGIEVDRIYAQADVSALSVVTAAGSTSRYDGDIFDWYGDMGEDISTDLYNTGVAIGNARIETCCPLPGARSEALVYAPDGPPADITRLFAAVGYNEPEQLTRQP